MPFALNLLYFVAIVAFSPLLLFRMVRSGKYREGLWEKFWGDAPVRIGEGPCLWFHAVSVGEVLLLRPLVREMARRRPGWEVVISTTTTTGLAVARRTFPDYITFYAPLDFSWATRRAIARIRPTVLALVELELWPNLIRAAKSAGAKVAIINARLSVRSYRGYRGLRGPLSSTLRRIDMVAAQNADYARRFVELGIPEERVSVTGSVKYDGLESDRDNAGTRQLRKELGLSGSDLIFVAGSTMEGEEGAALEAFRAAREQHHRLRMILVPRHAERFDKVAEWLTARGETVVRRSRIGRPEGPAAGKSAPIILIDTLGELAAVWGLADIAFVGGSLLPGRGGQNMMEPAAYGASVMFGPYTSNFRETVEQLLARNAARRVSDGEELKRGLREDLEDPETATARGAAGRSFVLAQHGASGRTLAELDRLVELSFTKKTA
ncbi:MAG: 3-deoxy-D-manno-octulosonic acid transferase [Isosphaeraceae bacterium]